MEPRLRRREGDPGEGRGLGQWVAEVVVQDDERPVLRVEEHECPLDQIPVGQVAGRIGADRLVDDLELDLDGTAPSPARLVEAGIDEEAVEPGIEPVRITKSGQVPPGSHQGVLDRVARELRVPQDESRGRVQSG
jgi:hypothetical protein